MNVLLKNILLPDKFQAIVTILLSLVSLALIHRDLLWSRFIDTISTGSTSEFSQVLDTTLQDYMYQLNQSEILYYIVVGTFWLGVSVLVLLILWTITNLCIQLYNTVLYEKYYWNHPRMMRELKALFRRIATALLLLCLAVITSVYGIPLWSHLFIQIFFESTSLWSALALGSSIIGSAVNLYILWVAYTLFEITVR